MHREIWHDDLDVLLFSGTVDTGERLADSLDVFVRPRVPKDTLSVAVLESSAISAVDGRSAIRGFPRQFDHGGLLLDASRLMLCVEPVPCFGIPTRNGWVCLAVGDIGLEVLPALNEGLTLSAHQREADGPLYIYGLVANGVQGVRVLCGEDWLDAEVGENAYFLKVQRANVGVRDVCATELAHRDNTRQFVSLKRTSGLET